MSTFEDEDPVVDTEQESGASNSKGHAARNYRGQRVETPSHPGQSFLFFKSNPAYSFGLMHKQVDCVLQERFIILR
jgi:hypothetical protein